MLVLNKDSFIRGFSVKASPDWLLASGARFSPGMGMSGFVHLPNYTAEYRIWGEGPPFVLVPGMAGGFELLGPLARLLARDYQVISYDLRGENNCFALRGGFGLDDLVGDLVEFLDRLGLERPTVMGISFGGALALELAARFPSRLGSLVVQGVGARFERGLVPLVAGSVLSRFPLPADNPFINQFFNLLFGSPPKENSLFEFVTRQCWQTDQGVMAHRLKLVERFNMGQRLRRIRVPTLVLSGDRDVMVSQRGLAELCQGIANSSLVKLPGCGHLAFVTNPEQVAMQVRGFLKK